MLVFHCKGCVYDGTLFNNNHDNPPLLTGTLCRKGPLPFLSMRGQGKPRRSRPSARPRRRGQRRRQRRWECCHRPSSPPTAEGLGGGGGGGGGRQQRVGERRGEGAWKQVSWRLDSNLWSLVSGSSARPHNKQPNRHRTAGSPLGKADGSLAPLAASGVRASDDERPTGCVCV